MDIFSDPVDTEKLKEFLDPVIRDQHRLMAADLFGENYFRQPEHFYDFPDDFPDFLGKFMREMHCINFDKMTLMTRRTLWFGVRLWFGLSENEFPYPQKLEKFDKLKNSHGIVFTIILLILVVGVGGEIVHRKSSIFSLPTSGMVLPPLPPDHSSSSYVGSPGEERMSTPRLPMRSDAPKTGVQDVPEYSRPFLPGENDSLSKAVPVPSSIPPSHLDHP